jgi:hypothetical protein
MNFSIMHRGKTWLAAICCTLLLTTGCATISTFDQHAYISTTGIKVDALNMMQLATEDYASHRQEVKAVNTAIEKTYEYERNRPKNEITLSLWNKLRDTSGHLWGGFVKRWQTEGRLCQGFIEEAQLQVGDAFDIIAQLESKKIKPKQVQK